MEWLVWGALVLTIIGIAVAFITSDRGSKPALPVLTQGLPSFTLTNQLGEQIAASAFSNQISIVDIVFTRCLGPCPEMTTRMSRLQSMISPSLPVKFVTLTADPTNDTPAVLKDYAERFKANPNRWWFLTGTKIDIARLAREGLQLTAQETKPEERQNDADLFIHSTVFVVLDRHGRSRGAIDSTEPEFNARIRDAIRRLSREK